MSRTEVARFGVADVSFGCAAGVDLQLQRVGAQVVFGSCTGARFMRTEAARFRT